MEPGRDLPNLHAYGPLRACACIKSQPPNLNLQPPDPTHNRFVFKVDLGNWSWTRFQGRSLDLDNGELLQSTYRVNWRYRRQAPAPVKD